MSDHPFVCNKSFTHLTPLVTIPSPCPSCQMSLRSKYFTLTTTIIDIMVEYTPEHFLFTLLRTFVKYVSERRPLIIHYI